MANISKFPVPTRANLPLALRLAGLWLIYAAWCQICGWTLSLAHSLNTAGYLAATPIALGLGTWFWLYTRPSHSSRISFFKWRHRLKRSPAFGAWCVVSILILIGGIINPPSNYDGLTYRLPKLLYWLQEGQYTWFDGISFRLNITGAGFEWMSVPLILFTKSDRGLFLLNFLPFLLLPGLFFVAARALGVRLRTARWWMWTWPMVYGIAMQAGSIGNDMVGAVLALASLAFASQALRGRPFMWLAFAALAAATMTAIKATTLPLGLPLGGYWLWVAYKSLGCKKLMLLAAVVAPFAILASFLPVAFMCWQHTGRWNGNPGDRYGFETKNPIAGLVGNSIQFATGAIDPPLLPGSHAYGPTLLRQLEKQAWYVWTKKNYGCFNVSLPPELPSEENAGIGIGISFLCLIWATAGSIIMTKTPLRRSKVGLALALGTGLAVLAFMGKSGIGGTPRLMVPFTPLLILSFLVIVPRSRKLQATPTQWFAIIPALCLIPALVLNPNRPVIPVSLIMSAAKLPSTIKARMEKIYAAYSQRGELLSSFRDRIPAGERVGFGGDDNPATPLFKPYGSNRQVIELTPQSQNSVQWVVGTRDAIERRIGQPLEEWELKTGFKKTFEQIIVSRVTTGPELWMLYHKQL